jgi:curved DNA-binding protein
MTAALTEHEARAILGLAPNTGREMLAGAFRVAVKAAHPDRAGGDPERFRLVLEAYRFLQAAPERPAEAPPGAPFVDIALWIAIAGGEVELDLPSGRRVRVAVVPGVRDRETLEVDGETVTARIAGGEAVEVRGSDVWVAARIPAVLLAEGGRATVATPLGAKTLWISRKVAQRRVVRLPGLGLPARGAWAAGDLCIRLIPDIEAPESASRARLRRFAADWAA